MKTNELLRELNKFTGIRAFNKSFISVLDSTNECLAQFGTVGSWLHIYNNCPEEVCKLIVEYYLTPLEEREEEKKYRLKSKLFNFDLEKDMYVIKSSYYEKFCLSTNVTQSFTQKEIDAMPFDTNFFIKEEIK